MHLGWIPARNVGTRAWTNALSLAQSAWRCKQGNRAGNFFKQRFEARVQHVIHALVHRLDVLEFPFTCLETSGQGCPKRDDVESSTSFESCFHFIERGTFWRATPGSAIILASRFISSEWLRARSPHGLVARMELYLLEINRSDHQIR